MLITKDTTTESVHWSERTKALKNLIPFFRMVWDASPRLALTNAFFRILKSLVPVATLYIGKLVIDEVIARAALPMTDYREVGLLIGLEFAIFIVSDGLSRGIGFTDSLLGDLLANRSSIRLMEHTGRLDHLAQFENSEFYDKLERARRQTMGRTMLMSGTRSSARYDHSGYASDQLDWQP